MEEALIIGLVAAALAGVAVSVRERHRCPVCGFPVTATIMGWRCLRCKAESGEVIRKKGRA